MRERGGNKDRNERWRNSPGGLLSWQGVWLAYVKPQVLSQASYICNVGTQENQKFKVTLSYKLGIVVEGIITKGFVDKGAYLTSLVTQVWATEHM